MKLPERPNPGKFHSIHTSSYSSVNPPGSPSVTLSPSAENPLQFPCNHQEKTAVNYLHEILVKIPTVHTLSVTSVIAPICAMSIPSVHLSDDKHQEIPDEFPSTNYRRNSHLK